MMDKLNVLWLASWFPSTVNESNGDFIERHAVATGALVKLTVLYVVKDDRLAGSTVKVEKEYKENYTVYKVYYGKSMSGALEKIISLRRYMRLQEKLYRQIVQERGMPAIVHVHVAFKAGLLALRLKKKSAIPFVITEHWTGYYPDAIPNIYSANAWEKKLHKRIFSEAAMCYPVSHALGKKIAENFSAIPFKAIPNVVDTSLFNYRPTAAGKFRFIHPSYLNYQKNPEGILAACRLLIGKGFDFEVLFVGRLDETLMAYAEQHDMQEHIFFKDAVDYPAVAKAMQQSHALLLFSRFENLPCVLLEALCCGLPVISTNVGGIAEVIGNANGILVDNEAVGQLVAAMETMMDNYAAYDRAAISADAVALFNYDTVGRQYLGQYRIVLAIPQ